LRALRVSLGRALLSHRTEARVIRQRIFVSLIFAGALAACSGSGGQTTGPGPTTQAPQSGENSTVQGIASNQNSTVQAVASNQNSTTQNSVSNLNATTQAPPTSGSRLPQLGDNLGPQSPSTSSGGSQGVGGSDQGNGGSDQGVSGSNGVGGSGTVGQTCDKNGDGCTGCADNCSGCKCLGLADSICTPLCTMN